MGRIRCMTIILSALAAACGGEMADDGAGSAEPIVRDSAGVRIVENGTVPAGLWRVETSPLFTLGWGPDDPTFTWVQSGQILRDGGVIAGDFNAGTIYRIGPDGSVMATWGRKGEGPGEYQGLDAILSRGDTIVVSDSRLRRVTVLSFEGDVLSTGPLAGNFLHKASSILSDGRLLLVPGEGYGRVTATRPEWVFERQPILAATSLSSVVDTLAVLPHLRRWYGTRGASPGPVSMRGRAGGFADGFAWSRADEPEVRWYDSSGRLEQVARWDEAPTPLTPDFRFRMKQVYEESYRSQGAPEEFVTAQLADLDEGLDLYEGPLPYWDVLHVDREGNVWLREYSLLTQPSERWRVLTRDGLLIGWVDLPDVVDVLDITADRVLAVRVNELDVPAVVVLQLLKN